MVYEWKIPIYNVPAQSAGEELERIKAKHGSLLPEVVVEESKTKGAVLHDCFEWDDQKAAEKYRITQAQQIIRTLVVNIRGEDEQPISVRAFVPISGEYEPINMVVSVPDMYAELLQSAKEELAAFQKKYWSINALSGVLSEINAFLIDQAEIA